MCLSARNRSISLREHFTPLLVGKNVHEMWMRHLAVGTVTVHTRSSYMKAGQYVCLFKKQVNSFTRCAILLATYLSLIVTIAEWVRTGVCVWSFNVVARIFSGQCLWKEHIMNRLYLYTLCNTTIIVTESENLLDVLPSSSNGCTGTFIIIYYYTEPAQKHS